MSRLTVDVPRRPCMDEEEYEAWSAHNRMANAAAAESPCADCLIGYAIEMRTEGRCNGRPRGASEENDLGWLLSRPHWSPEGVRRSAEARSRAKAERVARAVELRGQGLSNKQIAAVMGVQDNTIWYYLRNVA